MANTLGVIGSAACVHEGGDEYRSRYLDSDLQLLRTECVCRCVCVGVRRYVIN